MRRKSEKVSQEPDPIAKVEMIIDKGVGEYVVMVYPNTLGKLLKRPLWLGVLFVFLGLILGIFAGFAIARQQEGPFPSRDWIKKDDDGRTFFIYKSSGDLCHLSIYSGDKDRLYCDIHDCNG